MKHETKYTLLTRTVNLSCVYRLCSLGTETQLVKFIEILNFAINLGKKVCMHANKLTNY